MLQVKNTANNLGIKITGDGADFEEILHAIHHVIGPTGKRPCMAAAHTRVIKFCDDMQAAIANENFSFHALWPEAVFIAGALSGFIKFESEDLSKKSFIYDIISSPKVIFDEQIIKIRLLQSKIIHELERMVSKQSFSRILNIYGSWQTYFVDYTVQFLDIVNGEYINLPKEKRLQKLSAITQNILNRSGQYPETEQKVLRLAKQNSCPPAEIILDQIKYPDKLVW